MAVTSLAEPFVTAVAGLLNLLFNNTVPDPKLYIPILHEQWMVSPSMVTLLLPIITEIPQKIAVVITGVCPSEAFIVIPSISVQNPP